VRKQVSRWVAIYAFCIGLRPVRRAYVLSFFASPSRARVAGGIVVAMSGWRMLNQPDATSSGAAKPEPRTVDVSPAARLLPLTMR